MKKKWMTLIETVIVVVIIWMLSTILVRSYIQISQISFRVEQEKNVTQEILLLSEVLQNYSDRNTLDYEKYKELGLTYLKSNEGLTDTLFLTGIDGNITITTEWDGCLAPWEDIILDNDGKKTIQEWECRVTIKQNDRKFNITNPKKVRVTQLRFKIIPYAPYDDYFSDDGDDICDTNYLTCPHHPGFRIIWKAYNINYWIQRANNIMIPMQQFFSLQ